MRNFGKGKKFGGDRPSFGKPRFGGGSGGFDRPVMTKTKCDKCGKECEVPFKPNGRKPVLCSDCFRAEGAGSAGFERKNFDRPAPMRMPDPRPAMDEMIKINAKLDRILAILDPEIK